MAVRGTYTNAAYAKLAALGANQAGIANASAALLRVSYFKFGERGHTLGVPKVPSRTLTDIEADGSGPGDFVFQKSFDPTDVSIVGSLSNILACICLIEGDEANDRGDGDLPTFYELGIFAEDDTMLAYLTFDGQEKPDGLPFQHTVKVQYGVSE